jgi:hypothetical protein
VKVSCTVLKTSRTGDSLAEFNPIYPVVIFSFDEPKRAEPQNYCVTFGDLKVLEFQFVAIQLNRLKNAGFFDAAKSGCSSINVEDEYFQARTSAGEGGMFAVAGDFKIRPSKDATNFWVR